MKPDKRSEQVHESAPGHVTGSAQYTDDIPEIAATHHAAIGYSEQAHARVTHVNLAAVKSSPGVVAVLTAADIPGSNNCGPIAQDEEILAAQVVHYTGQPLFVVVATSVQAARTAARLANVDYEPLEPLLDAREADRQQQFVTPPMSLQRGDCASALERSMNQTTGTWSVGGQEQFYLEGQIAYAVPQEAGSTLLYSSTQHPTEMQHVVSHMLSLPFNQVQVVVRRMGGGFGGKESQSAVFCCIAALCAFKTGKPVKLRVDRDDDMRITGKRHPCHYDFKVGYDSSGRITACDVNMILDAGFSADLSAPVATRAICHVDNAYYLEHTRLRASCARTNKQSNTAFRGFGGPQGALAIEYAIDNIARELNVDPLEIRRRNFYGGNGRDTTPYGQAVNDNVIDSLVEELLETSDYQARRDATRRYNAESPVLKKGIALTPVKFGISFNLVHFNQAGALVHVYTDGSVIVNHGGTEMGQGLHTKIAQVVARVLGLTVERIRVTATDTSKVPNTSATAASTGADLNGKAAEHAALQIRERLVAVAATRFGCEAENIRFDDNRVITPTESLSFEALATLAYQQRVQLWSDGFYKTPGVSWDAESLTGNPFFYYAYGAAVSEVIIDTLTGESRLLGVDILHDTGSSLNPAIDKGQIEGGFFQGMGWLTSEELYWNGDGSLATHSPSTYKIPSVSDCPQRFNTALFEQPNRADTILRSKAVGEPPLLLAFSVFFAIRDAIASVKDHRVNPPLDAPATPERILRSIQALSD